MRALLKNLGKHSLIYGVGDLLSKSIGFLLIPLYTSYLSPNQYGVLDLLELTTYIVGMFLAMGIAQSLVRYYHTGDEHRVVTVALGTVGLACFAALLVLLPSSSRIANLVLGNAESARFFQIIFVTMAANLLADIPMTVFRIRERSILVTGINMARMTVGLSLNILFLVAFEMGVRGVLISGLITAIITGVGLNVLLLRETRLQWSSAVLRQMAAYGLPLVGSWVGMFVLNFSDRFMLQRFAGLDEVGIYALSYKFGMLPSMLLTGPFMMIWDPKRFALAKEGGNQEIYGRVFTYYLGLQVFLAVGIAATIYPTLRIIANPRYIEAHTYVLPVLLGYVAYGVYQYTQFGILIRQKTAVLGGVALFCGVVNIALNLWAIPRWGAAGAAWTTVTCFALLLGIITPKAQSLYRIPYETGRILIILGIGIIALFTASLISIENPWLSFLARGTASVVVMIVGLMVSGCLHPEERLAIAELIKPKKVAS